MSITVLMGVIGSDVHVVGNALMEYALRKEGIRVINLGILVSQEEFIDAAIESKCDAIFVSSLYGHGEIDCEDFRAHCIEAGIGNILLYIGGNLMVGKQDWEVVERTFLSMGFDLVFPPSTRPGTAIECLRKDIAQRRGGSDR